MEHILPLCQNRLRRQHWTAPRGRYAGNTREYTYISVPRINKQLLKGGEFTTASAEITNIAEPAEKKFATTDGHQKGSCMSA